MDYLLAAGIVLAIWSLLRNLGNERESELRLLEARIHLEAEEQARQATEAQERADGPSDVSRL